MSRQARAEHTRVLVVEAAAEVFLRQGYAGTGLGEIVERAGIGKGALYVHFASKEDLARAVLDAGQARLWAASEVPRTTARPAMEELIGLGPVALVTAEQDPVVAAMLRLYREIGDFCGTQQNLVTAWQDLVTALLTRAAAEGDVVVEDPAEVAVLVVGALAGIWMAAEAAGARAELPRRLERFWYHLLPSLAAPSMLVYLRQYAARRLLSR